MMEWIPIRVLLYIAAIDGKPIDNVIAEWTWFWNLFRRRGMTPELRAMLRKWSHAELWTPGADGRWTLDDGQFSGDCCTSTMGAIRDPNAKEGNGTVVRPAASVLRHPQRWSVSDDIWLPRPVYEDLIAYVQGKVDANHGYDKRAIASFGFPWRFHRADQEICSEHVDDDLKFTARRYLDWLRDCHAREMCPSKSPSVIFGTYQRLSRTDVPSPFLLGYNLILSGVRFRDLAA